MWLTQPPASSPPPLEDTESPHTLQTRQGLDHKQMGKGSHREGGYLDG